MKKYEVMYIIRPEIETDARKAIIEEVNSVFTALKSNVLEVKEWGLRELAYEINNCTKGFYVVLKIEATPEAIAEFDRVARIKESIIRHIVIAE